MSQHQQPIKPVPPSPTAGRIVPSDDVQGMAAEIYAAWIAAGKFAATQRDHLARDAFDAAQTFADEANKKAGLLPARINKAS